MVATFRDAVLPAQIVECANALVLIARIVQLDSSFVVPTAVDALLSAHSDVLAAHALLNLWVGGRNGIARIALLQAGLPIRGDEGSARAKIILRNNTLVGF